MLLVQSYTDFMQIGCCLASIHVKHLRVFALQLIGGVGVIAVRQYTLYREIMKIKTIRRKH